MTADPPPVVPSPDAETLRASDMADRLAVVTRERDELAERLRHYGDAWEEAARERDELAAKVGRVDALCEAPDTVHGEMTAIGTIYHPAVSVAALRAALAGDGDLEEPA